MGRRKISTTVYLEPRQQDRLKEISSVTKVPVAEYVRQAIDAILDRLKDIRAVPVEQQSGPEVTP